MRVMHERFLSGIAYLDAATALLRRVRRAHPTAGSLDAAELQWWWRAPRPTDGVPQLFWFDGEGRPEAAVVATDWGDAVALDPILMPDAPPERVAHVIERGLAHAESLGLGALDVVIDAADRTTRAGLGRRGFEPADGADLEVAVAWLDAGARPRVSPLHDGYRSCSRREVADRPHHLIQRNGPDVEARLRQTSLYRADLDLFVLDDGDALAAYGLFWFDPATATGVVEPMRTEDGHQRRGLAWHVLTKGVDLLAAAGAARVKVCFKPPNPAARDLYLGAGFVPDTRTVVLSRSAPARVA
jgi:GNAT superfamily N-acetyltransferase